MIGRIGAGIAIYFQCSHLLYVHAIEIRKVVSDKGILLVCA